MSGSFGSPQQYQQQYQQTQQMPLSPSASASAVLQRGGASASLYGPSLSRGRPSDAATIAANQAQYDAQLAAMEAEHATRVREGLAAQWEAEQARGPRGAHGGQPRTAFYNTEEGTALIRQARAELSRSGPGDRAPAAAASSAGASSAVQSSVQDNGQRVFHSDCVLPQNIATGVPDASTVRFQEYPLAEFNRFDLKARQWSGPDTDARARLKPAAFTPHVHGVQRRPLDVARRHDLVRSLNKNHSTNNYDHNRPFVAKHTNNLFSC